MMASIAFTGCSVGNSTGESTRTVTRRREVVVNGRRVKTVDVHSHCVIPEALALMGLKAEAQRRGLVLVVADRLSEMDETWLSSNSRTASRKLGLRGAAVGASVAGDEFSDTKFHPFWRHSC
jgi:hypothetical protein